VFALSRILVPTNHGEPSKAAIKYGVAFARQFNAQLFLVHVLSAKNYDLAIEAERAIETLMPEALLDPVAESPAGVVRNAAHEDLGQLLDAEDERATRAQYVLRAGRGGPGDEIVACATELAVELIVMGKHRLGFVEHLLAGSVTEKVVRHAPCPVLIVQHPEHEFVVEEHRQQGS
jgi:nucleotide-binding universal stress UspA family protein